MDDRYFERGYELPDAGFYIHENDDLLKPIYIPLPEMPEKYRSITNYNLPIEQQYFKYEEKPTVLKKFERHIKTKLRKQNGEKYNPTIDDYWNELNENRVKYGSIIDYIKTQWYYRLKWQVVFHLKGSHIICVVGIGCISIIIG